MGIKNNVLKKCLDLSHPLTKSNTYHPIFRREGDTSFPAAGSSEHSLQGLRTQTWPPSQGPLLSEWAA